MVALHKVETMLARVGMYNKYWGRAEIRELCKILWDGEEIIGAVNGRYEGGWAMFVATDHRLLLIDKKPWFLGLEDIRYDMIAAVDYTAGLFDAALHLRTFNKSLTFRSIRQNRLRALMYFVQQHVLKLRQSSYEVWQAQNLALQQAQDAENQLAMPRPTPQMQPVATASGAGPVMSINRTPLPRTSFMTRRRLGRFHTHHQ